MTDPYTLLGEALVAAAEREQTGSRAAWRVRAWLTRRLNAAAMGVALVLAGGAVAVAATGLLEGSPVAEPQGAPTPNAGSGVAVTGASRLLALRAADPEGGPLWGMRLVHTTRGEICVQIGRVHDDRLGQLGIDGAFHDDGRFHPLSADVLPNYTTGYAGISCILPGQTLIYSSPTQDRNAEWMVGPAKTKPAMQDLRAISYGLLGPHAVSIGYRTATGIQTRPVSPGTGAYMIVEPAARTIRPITPGGASIGWVSGDEVGVSPLPGSFSVLSTVTYRFGAMTCSVGEAVPADRRCPTPRPTPESAFNPSRSLHEPLRILAEPQSHASCAAAFLLDPCYRAEIEFKAPYAVTSAAGEYDVEAGSSCHNARPNGWEIIHDIKRGELVRTLSAGLFDCISTDEFEIRYLNRALGSSARVPHESVIVGRGALGKPLEVGAKLIHPVRQPRRLAWLEEH